MKWEAWRTKSCAITWYHQALSAAGCGVHYLKLKTHLRKLLALRKEQITLGCRKCSISDAFSRKEERETPELYSPSWKWLVILGRALNLPSDTVTHSQGCYEISLVTSTGQTCAFLHVFSENITFSPFSTWGHSNKFIFRNSLQKLTVKVRSITGFRNNKYEAGLQMAVKHLEALRLTSGSRVYALCFIFFINYLSLVWKKDYSLV